MTITPPELWLMEYTGKAPEPREWKGLVTGIRYWFGGFIREGFVDSRDAEKWLSPDGDGSRVFERIEDGD